MHIIIIYKHLNIHLIEPLKLPGVYEVLFCNETEDSPGMMLWRYPEPRVLTLVRITPVPFNTTEDPDISTADLGDVLQVGNGSEFVTKLIMASAGPILGKKHWKHIYFLWQ